MKVEVARQDGISVVSLAGRLDASTSDSVRDELLRLMTGEPPRLALNFEQVTYVSSAGLRVLFRLAKDVNAAGGRLALCRITPPVRQVFDLAGYSALVPIHDDLAAAVAAITAGLPH